MTIIFILAVTLLTASLLLLFLIIADVFQARTDDTVEIFLFDSRTKDIFGVFENPEQ